MALLQEGSGKVAIAWIATCVLRLASFLGHWLAIQPLLYGYTIQHSHKQAVPWHYSSESLSSFPWMAAC